MTCGWLLATHRISAFRVLRWLIHGRNKYCVPGITCNAGRSIYVPGITSAVKQTNGDLREENDNLLSIQAELVGQIGTLEKKDNGKTM